MNAQCWADMWKFLVRTVEIQISNTTGNITLKMPRTHLETGYCSTPPSPAVPPGSSDTFEFSNPPCQGCAGVLVYEAGAFTLAIYFSNPLNYCVNSIECSLELIPAKKEDKKEDMKNLKAIYDNHCSDRNKPEPHRAIPGTSQEPAQVSAEHIKVVATMSNLRRSVIRVVVGEEEDLGKEPRGETPSQ